MVKALLGKKVGMTQIFDQSGRHVPVTVLQVGPCTVTQVKTEETDGVASVQIGFGERKQKNTSRPQAGHFAKAGVAPKQILRDVPPDGDATAEPGQEIGVEIFEGVSHVDVVGVSKGRGFAGVIKRHGFSGSPATHGGRFGRRAGSIGSSASPSRVWKGHKMAGRMGGHRETIRNLEVVELDTERHLMLVKGAVVGSNGSYVLVRKAIAPPAGGRQAEET